jgi:hypothetical protein
MKEKYFNTTNIALLVVLIAVSGWKQGNLAAGLGAAVVGFFIGLIFVGALIMGLFMFIYNIFRPNNTIKLGWTERITAGLIGAILYALIIGGK